MVFISFLKRGQAVVKDTAKSKVDNLANVEDSIE